MDLREFVSETIKQITDGVMDAQKYGAEKEAKVAPNQQLTNVQFDVAVTTTEGTKDKAGAGILVAGLFGAGKQGQSESGSQSISRIKFSIAVQMPGKPVIIQSGLDI